MDYKLLEDEENGHGFDFKRYLGKIAKNALWFFMSILLFLCGAYLYLRYTIPLFQVSTYIVLKQPADNIALLGGSPFSAQGTGGSVTPPADPGNEIFKLQSTTLVGRVVDSLRLCIEVGKKGSVKSQALAIDELPVAVSVHRSDPEARTSFYELSLQPAAFTLKDRTGTVTGRYGEALRLHGDTILLAPKTPFKPDQAAYVFNLHDRSSTIDKYISRLKVGTATKTGVGLLEMTVKDELPVRAKAFIDALIDCYDRENLDFNNQALRKEMAFLNERLATVKDELEQQENTVKNFKVQNKVTEVSAKANQLLGNLSVIDAKRSDNELKKSYLSLVESNLRDVNGRDMTVASVGGVEDPVLAGRIEKYNQLIAEKRRIEESGTPQDPRLPAINTQIDDARQNVAAAVKNARRELSASNQFLASQEATTSGHFSAMPEKEKDYVQVNRVLNIKQSLYNFLLQRKEDKNIQLASSEIAESRVVDSRLSNIQTPKPIIIYAVAFLAGLLIPALVILIRQLLYKKIESRKDVELQTPLPIAGEIGRVKKSSEIVMTANAASPEAEQFRTLRTNIGYQLHGGGAKVLLVTSSVSKEGKSFVSLNLATGFSISNKKVVLLDLDLRHPGLSRKLELANTRGIANILAGEADIKTVVQPLAHAENLWFISAGTPLQPNTSELLLSYRMEDVFGYLKQQFDVIVIDTPPVAPVSDALALGKWADMTFFIIRHKYTLRSALKLINKLDSEQKLPAITLVVNSIEDKKVYNYGNDFSYGYGYPAEHRKPQRILWLKKEKLV